MFRVIVSPWLSQACNWMLFFFLHKSGEITANWWFDRLFFLRTNIKLILFYFFGVYVLFSLLSCLLCHPQWFKVDCIQGLNGSASNKKHWVHVRVKVLIENINLREWTEVHGSILFDLGIIPGAPLKKMLQMDLSRALLPEIVLTRSANSEMMLLMCTLRGQLQRHFDQNV